MSPVPEPIQKHVPAWKKLGLKLKFAKEAPEDTQPRQNGVLNHKKRKAPTEEENVTESPSVERSTKKLRKSKLRAEEIGEAVDGNWTPHEPLDEDKPGKKSKKSKTGIEEPVEAVNGDNKPSNEPTNAERPTKKTKKSEAKPEVSTIPITGKLDGTHNQEPSPPPALKTTPASKGKSVSFTPETKTKDGDSVKSLYKTWIAKQTATDPSFDPSTVNPALRSMVPSVVTSPNSPSAVKSTSTSTPEPPTKTNKKPSKKPKTRLPKTSSGTGPSRFDPVLTYLTTHHTSPQTWKFSKSHQNQILKHLFSINHIPPSYDSALLPYIRGLKGTSARLRVRKDALAVREDDDKWLASEPAASERMENETAAQCNARRRRDYEAAVAQFKQTLEEKEDEREERELELLGENKEWDERVEKRRRAEIVLWCVGLEDEVVECQTSSRQDTFQNEPKGQLNSGLAQLVHAARDPGPAPRTGRGVGMGMGGVEVIDAGGIARGSLGKKVVFSDEGPTQAGWMNRVNGFVGANGVGKRNGVNGVNGVKTPEFSNGMKPKRKRKHKRRTGVPDDDDSSSSSSSSSNSSSEESKEEQRQPRKLVMKRGDSSSGTSSTSSSSGNSDSDSIPD